MAGGDWVKVHRSMLDTAIWSDEWLVKLWIWCLLKANYAPRAWNGETVDRGQFITGRNTAADELGVSPSKWYRGIVMLADMGNVKVEANSKWTRITVCNYSRYQDADKQERTANEQQMNSEWTPNEHQMNNERTLEKKVRSKERKKDICVTASSHDDVPFLPEHTTTSETYSDDFERFWKAYPSYRRRDKGNAWKAWKRAIKAITPAELIERAEEYAASPVGRGEFSKLPASWLNARGWEDSPEAWGSAPERRPRIPTAEELASYNPNG